MNYRIFEVVRNRNFDEYLSIISNTSINVLNKDRQNLLQEAIAFNADEIAKEIIQRDIDLDSQDKNGQTSLHYVALYGKLNLAKLILEKGATINIFDKYGNNPLWTAVFNARGNYEIIKIFLKYGADPLSRNGSGKSPLDFAMQINDNELINLLQEMS